MLLIILISIISSVKLFSNVKNILALTSPPPTAIKDLKRPKVLHYLIHIIAAKNLQLLEADNIQHNLGFGDLRKKGAVNWLCMVNALF